MSAKVSTARAHKRPPPSRLGAHHPCSPNHSHTHCPLCHVLLFLVTLHRRNSPLSPSRHSILNASSRCQVKPCSVHTHSENIFRRTVSQIQVLSENKIVDVTDTRSSVTLIPDEWGHREGGGQGGGGRQNPPLCTVARPEPTAKGPRATRLRRLRYTYH